METITLQQMNKRLGEAVEAIKLINDTLRELNEILCRS